MLALENKTYLRVIITELKKWLQQLFLTVFIDTRNSGNTICTAAHY